MVPVWILFYHDLIGVVILLVVAYWALTQRDRINKRYSDMRAEMEETEERLGQVREENAKLRQYNGRLRFENKVLTEKVRGHEVTQAELEMLEKFKRDGQGANQINITALRDVTIGGDVTGRDHANVE